MKILGIETSCDETAAAVVENGKTILTSAVASSSAIHRKYGGIVPEVAARKQVESIIPVLTEVMKPFDSAQGKQSIDAIAVTVGPGLIGSLLVGVETAKTLAYAWNKPIIPVNHVVAHMYANFISSQSAVDSSQFKKTENNLLQTANYELPTFPAISLVVSGGHTELYLMQDEKTLKWLGGTLDDAAGEAFDKTARLLGFENRGGPAIQEAADKFAVGSSQLAVKLPRPLMDDSLNFSFSGLKTAVLREVNKLKTLEQFSSKGRLAFGQNNVTTRLPARQVQQLAYETQEAITDVLVAKTLKAAQQYHAKSVLISGGVAANTRLREKLLGVSLRGSAIGGDEAISNLEMRSPRFARDDKNIKFNVFIPPVSLCTDNAIYIACYAYFHRDERTDWRSLTAQPNLNVEVNGEN